MRLNPPVRASHQYQWSSDRYRQINDCFIHFWKARVIYSVPALSASLMGILSEPILYSVMERSLHWVFRDTLHTIDTVCIAQLPTSWNLNLHGTGAVALAAVNTFMLIAPYRGNSQKTGEIVSDWIRAEVIAKGAIKEQGRNPITQQINYCQ